MSTHILIEKAFIYPMRKSVNDLSGYQYDDRKGFWISSDTGEPLVSEKNRPKPRTKKHDVETGEDAKGE